MAVAAASPARGVTAVIGMDILGVCSIAPTEGMAGDTGSGVDGRKRDRETERQSPDAAAQPGKVWPKSFHQKHPFPLGKITRRDLGRHSLKNTGAAR